MKNIILKREGEPSWVTWIKKRVRHNLNFLSITTGPTGSGKSYANLTIAHMIDPDFDVEKQCVFGFSEFMTCINGFNGDDPELSKKKYKVVIFDEVQISVNKKEWQSKINKLFNYLVSTFRHQNIIVFMNSPYADFVDSATAKLLHAKFECKGWSKKTRKSQIRGKVLQYNDKFQKFYEHSLFVIQNGKVKKFDGFWFLPEPPEHLQELYEKKKSTFTELLNRRITKEISDMEKQMYGEDDDEKNPELDLNPDSMQPLLWQEAQKGFHTQNELAERIAKIAGKHINVGTLSINAKRMRKKGYDIRKFRISA